LRSTSDTLAGFEKKAKENGIKRKIYKGRKKVIKREKGLEVPQNKAEKNLFF